VGDDPWGGFARLDSKKRAPGGVKTWFRLVLNHGGLNYLPPSVFYTGGELRKRDVSSVTLRRKE